MNLRTLIDATTLATVPAGAVLIVDCRFELGDPARGARDYGQGHIPGAVYADLNRDLSDLTKQGLGRHPLPDATAFSAVLRGWGWTPHVPVVAYDAAGGAIAAARLWWMLRLVGARDVAVLDGGYSAWTAAGLPVESTTPTPRREASQVHVDFDRAQIVYSDELHAARPDILLLDARAAPRFRGEAEPIDPIAGHVPGARNRPFSENLTGDGRFKPAAQLRAEFDALLGTRSPRAVAHMCGSGVTACLGLLAMERAGLAGSRVYAPSWSGYISDPANPVAKGQA